MAMAMVSVSRASIQDWRHRDTKQTHQKGKGEGNAWASRDVVGVFEVLDGEAGIERKERLN